MFLAFAKRVGCLKPMSTFLNLAVGMSFELTMQVPTCLNHGPYVHHFFPYILVPFPAM